MEDAIDKGKASYYSKLLDNTSNSIKNKWTTIRQLINRKKVDENTCTVGWGGVSLDDF